MRLKTINSTQAVSPILDIRDGVIITKNGRYVKLLEFSPMNFELRSPFEQANIILQFGNAIRTWPRDVHIKIVTTPSDVSRFINDLRKCQENEPSEKCREMQSDQMALLDNISKTQSVMRRFFVSFAYEDPGGFRLSPDFNMIKRTLDKQARSIQMAMESCGNSLISDDSRDYLMSAFYSTICKGQSEHILWEDMRDGVISRYKEKFGEDLNLNRIPVNDFISPERIDKKLSPNYMIIDGKYLTHCYIPSDAYSERAYAGWLQTLFSFMDDVYVDFWIHKEPVETVQRKLQFYLKNNKIKEKHSDDINRDYEDIVSAITGGYHIKQALENGDEFCYMSTIMSIYADSLEELNDKFREMREHCIRNDLNIRRLTFQQNQAFLACYPHAAYNKAIFGKSKRNVMASQLGSCYPFTAYELNDRGGVFLGINARYGSPVFINNFDTIKYKNANMMIFGPPGSGKTYTLLCFLLRMRQKGIQTFVIAPDKGFEFYRACDAVEGQIVRIAPGSPHNINIMEIRKRDTSASDLLDGGETNKTSILVTKIQQLHRFFSLIITDITATEKQILDEALVETYRKFGITNRNRSLIDPNDPTKYKTMPVLGDLYETLTKSGNDAKRIALLLKRFVTGTAKSFNSQTNVDLDNKFVVLDVSGLTKELLPMGMFIAIDYVLDKAKADRTTQKIIAIDELWRLMKVSELSAEFAVEIFKIIRGYAGAAIGATQDIGDIFNNEYGTAILNCSQTKILLSMDKKEAEVAASVMELTSEELKQLMRTETQQSASGKRRASKGLLVANSNHLFINIKASPTEHDLITTSRADLARLAAKYQEAEPV